MDFKKFLFKYRSYTPIPLLLIAVYGADTSIKSIAAGSILILTGEFLRIWGVAYAGPGTRETRVKASQLVRSGPFAYQRNPLYTGNILMYIGFAVFSNFFLPWLPVIVLLFFSIQYYFIILHEEEFLSSEFGEQYEIYKKEVNRFIPKFKRHKFGENNIEPDFKEAVRSDRRTFQSIILLSLILIIRSYYI